MNYIEQMFDLQRQLNDHTNGVMWVDGITKENRKISWYRCIYMEAAEAIDSFNWKHWKSINTDPDWDNIRVELVDIWHFIMSESIRIKDENYANKYLKLKPQGNFNAEVLIGSLEEMLNLSVASNIDPKINNIRDITDLFFTAISQIDMVLGNYTSAMLSRINSIHSGNSTAIKKALTLSCGIQLRTMSLLLKSWMRTPVFLQVGSIKNSN